MPQVTILLCGPPRLEWSARPIELGRQKALALVAYLALARDPVSRDELASLCWPELSQERARAALRTTLPALTTAVPIDWITADRRHVRLQPTAVEIDFIRFAELVARVRQHAHGASAPCADCVARLQEAAALYRGEFLQGFSLASNPDFETWQLAQREALRHEIVWVLRTLTNPTEQADQPSDEAALRYGRRWLELDPLNEAAHRALMELYAAAGRRSDALLQYHACAAVLQADLGVAPAPETIALYEQIARNEQRSFHIAPPIQRLQHGQLPAEPGGFVGRATELAWLVARLRDPDCRLITLTGPGGMGKTRLALRAAAQLAADFNDGTRMAPLGDARSAPEALRHIAAAIDPTLVSNDPPLEVLQRILARRELLLVLDNLEQIPAIADYVSTLLSAAPGLKLLATSRERLALRAEHILPLGGLAVPDALSDPVTTYGAVQLFIQRARQMRPDFALDALNQAAIVQICTLVEGMPLGLELAAAWIRTLTPAEIAAEIGRSPDFLQAAVRDLPDRQRSLRAVFAHSWRLLSPTEQDGFRRLSIFRGGFTIAAAVAVAELHRDTLVALENKSLLRRSADGRYDFHPLLRQYAAEHMAVTSAEEAALQARHARYIAGIVAELAPRLGSGDHLLTLANDNANMQVAWFWAVNNAAFQTLGLMVEGLARFCELRSYRQEAEAALAYAEARLTAEPPTDTATLRVLAHVQAWRGHFCQFLGRYDEAAALLEQSLAVAHHLLEDPALIAFGLNAQGINANAYGDHRRAIELHQTSLALYQALGDQAGIGEVFNRMGGAAFDMGDLVEARRCWQASHVAFTATDDLCGMARALNNLGEVARILGEYAESRRLSEESLALHTALGPSWSISPVNNLAILARLAGRFDEAQQLHERSLAACHTVGDQRGAVNTTLLLGELELARDRIDAAEAYLTTSLDSFRTLRQRHGMSACLTRLAEVALKRGDYTQAADLARESLAIAEASSAQLTAGRALSSLGMALTLSGDRAAGAAAFAAAEATLTTIGARADAQTVAERRRMFG